MNHFFALALPTAIQQYINDNIVRWWQPAMGEDFVSRWYAPDDYHVTLKFLGDVATSEQVRLSKAVEAIAARTNPFTLSLAAPGTFPKNTSRGARVFWMGIAESDELTRLAANIDAAMTELGFPPESRTYMPHVTLMRTRRYDRGRSDSGVVTDERPFPEWTVGKFALMQTLPPEQRRNALKARYNTVHLFPFGTQPSSAE